MIEATPVLLLADAEHPAARFDPAAVLEPGAILPEQLDARSREDLGGSRALMLAVLEEAILCIVGGARATGSGRRGREAARARQWVSDRDPSWLFSFENVCSALDIEPEPLRDALFKLKHEDLDLRQSRHRVLRNRSRVEVKRTKRSVDRGAAAKAASRKAPRRGAGG